MPAQKLCSSLSLALFDSLGKWFCVKLKQFIIWGISFFILTFIFTRIWLDPTKRSFFDADYWIALSRFEESMRVTNARYVEQNKSKYSQLADKAISGMVSRLDRHSSYYPPKEYESFKDDTHRRYVGIGIMIRKVDDGVLVTRVFPDGPAEKAGLLVGEYILRVEDELLSGQNLSEVSDLIKGKEDTIVRILVRSRKNVERSIDVNRKEIKVSSVEGVQVDANGTAYLRLVQFTSRSGDEFSKAMQELRDKGMKNLIVDLRDNSGGLLSAAIDITQLFISDGQLVVSIKGRKKEDIRKFTASSVKGYPDVPLIVLMNEGSASASEIVGGALSVLGRARIVGEKSFGKGSVQTIFPVADQSGLRLTTAMYFLPDGSTIHDQGIEPDILVECSDGNETKLRIQRYSQEVMDDKSFEKQFGFFPIADVQLQKAKELLFDLDKQNSNL